MLKTRNSINKENNLSKNKVLFNEENMNKCRYINNNDKNIYKQNYSYYPEKEILTKNISEINEDNIIIKILEEKNNEDSLSQISKLFNKKDLNFYKIHDKTLYNENNFLYNTIIKNNSKRIQDISYKLSSMKNPDEISTKETKSIILTNENKKRKKNENNDEVKFSCCGFSIK